jgi:hypothetical protein
VFGGTADGLLDPRLRDPVEGRSNSSLRDFEDYSRPIGGVSVFFAAVLFGFWVAHDVW